MDNAAVICHCKDKDQGKADTDCNAYFGSLHLALTQQSAFIRASTLLNNAQAAGCCSVLKSVLCSAATCSQGR